jgi:hypothetical protein
MKQAVGRVAAGWPALPESVTLLGVPVVIAQKATKFA